MARAAAERRAHNTALLEILLARSRAWRRGSRS